MIKKLLTVASHYNIESNMSKIITNLLFYNVQYFTSFKPFLGILGDNDICSIACDVIFCK
jgi:hypothetical protein